MSQKFRRKPSKIYFRKVQEQNQVNYASEVLEENQVKY